MSGSGSETTGDPGRCAIKALPSGARSQRVHAAVLKATRELLDEGGLSAATIDAIATRSGVSKVTVYKHWPSRAAVAAEAFGAHMADAVLPPHTDDPRADLIEHARRVSEFYSSRPGIVFTELLGACAGDHQARAYFHEFFLASRRDVVNQLWRRGVASGDFDPSIDEETADDVIFGPLIYRLLVGHKPMSAAEADLITTAALNGLLAQPR